MVAAPSMSAAMVGGLDVARELIPATARRWIYAGISILGYALGATAVGVTAAGQDVPTFVTVALAVTGFLAGPVGQLAAANTPRPLPEQVDEPAVES